MNCQQRIKKLYYRTYLVDKEIRENLELERKFVQAQENFEKESLIVLPENKILTRSETL